MILRCNQLKKDLKLIQYYVNYTSINEKIEEVV